MEFTKEDLSDILHLSGVSQGRWLELLTKSLEVMNEENKKSVLSRMWPIAGELLWNSVLLVARKVEILRLWVNYIAADEENELEQDFRNLRDVITLIRQLERRLPEEVSQFDEVLTYCGRHSRSWLHISMNYMNRISVIARSTTPIETAARLFESDQYEHEFVNQSVEIEKKAFNRLAITPEGRERITVEEYLLYLVDDEETSCKAGDSQNANQRHADGTKSALEQTEKQTIEQTVSDQKQTEVGQNPASEKKPWTDLATDLKKRWFTEMRKRKAWIPRKTFFIDFFEGSDGQRGKWKELSATTEDRRFQDNPDRWKTESEALKDSLKNRR